MQEQKKKQRNRNHIFLKQAACLILACLMLLQTGVMSVFAAPAASVIRSNELHGVWISYLDWEKLPADQESFKREVGKMLDRCVELKMNAVFVHVRADSDAMYPSSYFPWSRFVTGTQGKNPGFDPFAVFVNEAHNRGLQIHAWINPYRVTGYHNTWNQVSDQSPAKRWLSDADTSNDRWVLKQNGAYYLNPSIPQVQELIINGVREIVQKYTVDGIHFDDYFYPEVDNNNPNRWFDKPEYDASGSSLSITQWRRENVNELIRGVYQAVKAIRPSAQFGVSPEGYVDHLRSETRLFVDVDTWLSHDGYIDYIMPQCYWGFEHQLPNGHLAPYAYENNLKTWVSLKKKGNAKLYIGLAMYKAGSNSKDNTGIPEWKRFDDIISRQVEAGRATGEVSGYCFYAYSSFQESDCQKEVNNLMNVLR